MAIGKSMDSSGNAAPKNSSAGSSWRDFLPKAVGSLLDEQRVERLDQCRILDEILSDCRRKGDAATLQLEDVPAGIRMVRYFDWRNISENNCQREAHAVWACRAIALGCGADLVELRKCFHGMPDKSSILGVTETAYEPKTASLNDFPCRKLEEAVGSCVRSNLRELAQRRSPPMPAESSDQ